MVSLQTVLVIQYLCIIGLYVECWIVLKRWRTTLHSYLFFASAATLINSIGYLLELKAETEEAYITALQLSYAGRVWVAFAMFLFTLELCKVHLPHLITTILALIHLAIYGVILSLKDHALYYTDTRFTLEDGFPRLIHGNGPVHQLLIFIQIIYILAGYGLLIRTRRREKRTPVRKRLSIVMAAILVEIVFYIIQTIHFIKVYDVTMPGFLISTLLMYIAIFRYDLLGARDIARDFMIDRLSEGIIAIDNEGEVQYFNEPARNLYPVLTEKPETVVAEIMNAISRGETVEIGERIYTPEENDLLYQGESFGRLYVLTDSTEHYKRLKNEKKMLRQELLTDPVTGFYNRKGMEYYSEKMYEEAVREDVPLFICVADMNGLKYINDNFGHELGDRALKELALIIRDSLFEGDMAFRTGGDEFLIIGKRKVINGSAEEFGSHMEKVIKEHNSALDLPYQVDMSFGPVVAKPDGHEGELQELIKKSDAVMYEMKKNRDPFRR